MHTYEHVATGRCNPGCGPLAATSHQFQDRPPRERSLPVRAPPPNQVPPLLHLRGSLGDVALAPWPYRPA